MNRSSELRRWKEHAVNVRHEHNLPSRAQTWVSRPGVSLMAVPKTPRILETIDVCFAYMRSKDPQASFRQVATSLFCDFSQSINRLPVRQRMPTPTTSATIYSYELDRVVSPWATLRFLGWPCNLLGDSDSFPAAEQRRLSGNAFSVPISGMMSMLLYLNPHAPWWERQSQ